MLMKIGLFYFIALLSWFQFVSARRVTNLKLVEDPETGNVKRKLIDKRSPKRLPLDLNKIVEDSKSSHDPFRKRSISRPQYVVDILGGKHDDRVCIDSRLSVLQDISLFSEYGREVKEAVDQFEDPDEELVVIAPTNRAIMALPLKPWAFPENIDALEAREAAPEVIDNAINANIAHFVKSHVVAQSSDFRSESNEIWLHSEVDATERGDIVLKREGDEYYVASVNYMEFHRVERVDVAANGVILVIDSCLSWP